METTIHLKTKKSLKDKVEKIADRLGLTLTGLINLNLTQLVESKEIVINLQPKPNRKTIIELNKLRLDTESRKNLSSKFKNSDEALKWLNS